MNIVAKFFFSYKYWETKLLLCEFYSFTQLSVERVLHRQIRRSYHSAPVARMKLMLMLYLVLLSHEADDHCEQEINNSVFSMTGQRLKNKKSVVMNV